MKKNVTNRLKALAVGVTMLATGLTVPSLVNQTAPTVNASGTVDANFAKALQYSMYFYDSNMCGVGVGENSRFVWRDDCHTYDEKLPLNTSYTNLSSAQIAKYGKYLDPDGDGYVDVSGGYHDAGDHVKFGMPESYAGSTLGWGYYEFRDAYKKTGQDDHIETILRYFNDYFMKCTFLDEKGDVAAFCYQVGEGEIDHAFWNSPENDEMKRVGFFLTAEKPQTDYVVAHAASLAVNYLNFKDTDPAYAAKNLKYAKALFKFAKDNPKQLSDNGDGPRAFYASSKWEDDYCWAAGWLFLATEDVSYLESALPYIDYYAPPGWMHCWNDVWNGSSIIWGVIDMKYPELHVQDMYRKAQNKSEYEDANFWTQTKKHLDERMVLGRTPGGYNWYLTWGSARYNTAVQLTALCYDKYQNNGKPSVYSQWAKGQMEYLMGKNPINRCYIVGCCEKSAKFPHHRAASCTVDAEDPSPHRYVLYGALVGGPQMDDSHNDVTRDWIDNEVTIDYNAAFVGACAGLYEFFGTPSMTVTPDFPPAPNYGGGDDKGGNDYWVDVYAADDKMDTGAGVTKLSFKVRTNATKIQTGISVRYYFSIAEMADKSKISEVKASTLYDQANMEAKAVSVLSGPIKYDKVADTYYVEIKWDDYKIANSNKMYQMTLGLYYGEKWDPTNDWSYQGIEKRPDIRKDYDGDEKRNDYFCVYAGGELIGGIEPDGTTPKKEQPTTATSSTTLHQGKTVYGDVNLDGDVTIEDVVLVRLYLLNTAKYPLTDEQCGNALVISGQKTVQGNCAVTIQDYVVEKIKSLPYTN